MDEIMEGMGALQDTAGDVGSVASSGGRDVYHIGCLEIGDSDAGSSMSRSSMGSRLRPSAFVARGSDASSSSSHKAARRYRLLALFVVLFVVAVALAIGITTTSAEEKITTGARLGINEQNAAISYPPAPPQQAPVGYVASPATEYEATEYDELPAVAFDIEEIVPPSQRPSMGPSATGSASMGPSMSPIQLEAADDGSTMVDEDLITFGEQIEDDAGSSCDDNLWCCFDIFGIFC